MKFPDKEHTIYACGDKLIKNKTIGECCYCLEPTKWYSTTMKDYFCSFKCLESDINELLGADVNWWDLFK